MIISSQEMYDLFQCAYKLPTSTYKKLSLLRIPPQECANIAMGNAGRTNASSNIRYVGTDGLSPCLGIGIYNPKIHATLVAHYQLVDRESFQECFKYMNNIMEFCQERTDDPLNIHIIGGNNAVSYSYNKPPKQGKKVNNYIGIGQYKKNFAGFLYAIEQRHSAKLITFDVNDKPHPSGFALDSHNGRLIATSELKPAPWHGEDKDEEPREYPKNWQTYSDSNALLSFDGTLPAFQKSTSKLV